MRVHRTVTAICATSALVLASLGAVSTTATAAESASAVAGASSHASASAAARARGRVVTLTYGANAWRAAAKVAQPRLRGGKKVTRIAVKKWATKRTAAYLATIRTENANRVRDTGGACSDDRRAIISSTATAKVVAKRWISVSMSFTAFPGCVGTSLWSQQYTATWRLKSADRAKLRDFVVEVDPLEQLVWQSLDYPCTGDYDYLDRAPLRRWTVEPKGMSFWLERYEWGIEGACGAQRTFIPWSGLKAGPAGKVVAAYYGQRTGYGQLTECWPNFCNYTLAVARSSGAGHPVA